MTTFEKLTNGNVKITIDGKVTYLSDNRVKVYLGSNNTKLIIECFSDDFVLNVSEITQINGVAAPADPELLAQKLLEDVFFLNKVNGGGVTEATLLTLFQTLPGYAPEKALIINSAGDGLEFVNVQINQL